MLIIEKIADAKKIISDWKNEKLTIGFVPTMGYLHDGHKSLIEKARQENDRVVVSIFVNPIQFAPNEDFEKYPRDTERDLNICNGVGCDLVFLPTVEEMYPAKNLVYIDVDELGNGLCGRSRQNHFRGVCTVVAKLFHITSPNRAYFGQKDAQQLAIIKRMVLDLNMDTKIIPCPIIRERDGLALSSRNTYLSTDERRAALVLHDSLKLAKELIIKGERNAQVIINAITEKIRKEPLARIDYIEIVDLDLLMPVLEINVPVLIALAVYIGKTRLIDNATFEEM